MKKTIFETVLNICISTFIYSILSLFSSLLLSDKGCVRISESYQLSDSAFYQNIEIVNYGDTYCDGLYLKVPVSTEIYNEKYISTFVIHEESTHSEEFKLLKIDMIQPKTSTVFVLTLQSKDDKVYFTNLKEKKFSLETQGVIESPKWKLFKQLLPNAILYIVIFSITQFVGNYYINKKQREIDESIKKKEEEIKIAESETDSLKQEVVSIKQDLNKHVKETNRKIYFAKKQLNDFSRENEFWRNTIRQLLYNGDKKHKQAEKLFEIVTENLQTYTIKSKSNLDLNEILFLADELYKAENNEKQPYKNNMKTAMN